MPPFLHISTILSQRTSTLRSHIAGLIKTYGNQGNTLVFSLSSNFREPSDLQKTVSQLLAFNAPGQSGTVLGCLSDSFDTADLSKYEFAPSSPILSCSVAVLPASSCTPFHSALASVRPPQVGRWHSFREKEKDLSDNLADFGDASGDINWQNVWKESNVASVDSAPGELATINPSTLSTLLYFTAPQPSAFLRSIDKHFTKSHRLGVVAGPTHFITGRPATMFYQGDIVQEGAVGIALLRASSSPTLFVRYHGCRQITRTMVVTSTEGNVVNSLDGSNPSQILLDALKLHQLGVSAFKDEDEYYLGVVSSHGEVSEMYKITAGDPSSRGGMLSLLADEAPPVGAQVQIFYKSPLNSVPLPLSTETKVPAQVISFLTVPEHARILLGGILSESEALFEGVFLTPSTLGSYCSSGSRTWHSSMAGSSISLKWETA